MRVYSLWRPPAISAQLSNRLFCVAFLQRSWALSNAAFGLVCFVLRYAGKTVRTVLMWSGLFVTEPGEPPNSSSNTYPQKSNFTACLRHEGQGTKTVVIVFVQFCENLVSNHSSTVGITVLVCLPFRTRWCLEQYWLAVIVQNSKGHIKESANTSITN